MAACAYVAFRIADLHDRISIYSEEINQSYLENTDRNDTTFFILDLWLVDFFRAYTLRP